MNIFGSTTTSTGTAVNLMLKRIATAGSLLALTILGASILLRLGTVFDPTGQAISTFPEIMEYGLRLLHRLSASGVALLAICSVLICWSHRRSIAHLAKPTAWIVASTIALALIGPLTPGYRVEVITIANVVGGMLLLIAFWWLQASAATTPAIAGVVKPFAWVSLTSFLVLIATGAAASAHEMHGVHWPAVVHLCWLVFFIIPIGSLLREVHCQRPITRRCGILVGLLALQMTLGYLLMGYGLRPLSLSFVHAMLSPLIAMVLVSIVLNASTPIKR